MEVLLSQSSAGGDSNSGNTDDAVDKSGIAPNRCNNNLSRDLEAGRSILSVYQNSSYMTWDRGSTLIFGDDPLHCNL